MQNFWDSLPRPFFALAPLEDVTDAAFRRLIAGYGKPAVVFSEFTSADGLVLADERGQRKLRQKLLFSDIERPIVAQLFSANTEYMERAAAIVRELGFDGIDINMGCPANEVVDNHCGAALINDPLLARALIRAAQKTGLPVSVKTRLGYNTDVLDAWLPELLAENPAAVTIHARTRKEMSDVPARWERIARAVEIRNSQGSKALILGNGDVKDIADAREKARQTGADGVMLGRAIFGNPWLFDERAHAPSPGERIEALIGHLELFDELLGSGSNFAIMKKHFKSYISGWDNAKELRVRLMETDDVVTAMTTLRDAQKNLHTPAADIS